MAFSSPSTSFLLSFSPPSANKSTTSKKSTSPTTTILCNSSTSPNSTSEKSTSLSDQLKPLSLSLLQNPSSSLPQKPKPTWVNPSKPKPTVLSLTRHKRHQSTHTPNPNLSPLAHLSAKLSSTTSDSDFNSALSLAFPQNTPPLDSSVLLLSTLRPYQNSLRYFNWLRAHHSPPVPTILYNLLFKSLRSARQYSLIETLARQMLDENTTPLDNVTYSTLITCAKRSRNYSNAIAWFEHMYKSGIVPDEVTYSAVLDVYARLGKKEEVLALYERARASGWTPDHVAFSVLARMFGETGDYDGIMYVLSEMRSVELKPNVVVYNALLEAMGKAGKPGLARSLFEEMVEEEGVVPNAKTLTAMVKIYGKARWGKDALELWGRMRENKWPADFYLYNTLLSMCADLGLVSEAEELFEDMKRSAGSRPDSWSYTAMINIYGSLGKAERALEVFDEMLANGVEPNVMGCTCLIQCLAKAGRVEDAVKVFDTSLARGIKPDDRLCGCLLSVVALCEESDLDSVLACLRKANARLVKLVVMIGEEKTSFDSIKEEFRTILNEASIDVRRPFCNCLIDICRNRNYPSQRANELLYLGTVFGLYPGLHKKTAEEWSLNLRSLSVGAANTAFEEWMKTVSSCVENAEALPRSFLINTGAGTHKFSQGLPVAFASHLKTLQAPFQRDEMRSGSFVSDRDDVISWLQSGAAVSAR